MKAKYTKKAFNDIFNTLYNDSDFVNAFREYWKEKNQNKTLIETESERAEMRNEYRKTLAACITDYLYNFDYLDAEYLDISYLRIKQHGRACLVDLDTIYDIFKTDLHEKLNEQ